MFVSLQACLWIGIEKKKKDEVPEIQEERVPNMALWQEKRSPGASNLVEEHAGLTVYCEFSRC